MSTTLPSSLHSPAASSQDFPVRRLWFPTAILVAYWLFIAAINRLDLAISEVFLSTMGVSALYSLLFLIWWLAASGVSVRERMAGLTLLMLGLIVAGFLVDPSVGPIGIVMIGLPMIASAWTLWAWIARRRATGPRLAGIAAAIALPLAANAVVRVDGVDGDNHAAVAWRWARTAEDEYLSARKEKGEGERAPDAIAAASIDGASEPLAAAPGDWLEFRGPNRQGELHGVQIATDWENRPPREVWRRRIGPAWSSILIVGSRLYTQEQRGEEEVTVCLDAGTGEELWSYADQARFSDGQAGAGPRGTPTFSDGRIFALGATGILNCLDARTGQKLWRREMAADAKAPLPMWGFSSSPLVVGGVVIVYAGGPEGKGMLAYRESDGEPAWSVETGPVSYSSPQAAEVDGQKQVWILSDSGLTAVDPASGKLIWQHPAAGGAWRVVQPRQLDASTLLIGSEDLGLVRLGLQHEGDAWSAEQQWKSRAIRPAYNDFVVSDGHVYGFDESIFCCVDIATGKRRWKSGRYGHGQVLLIVDQKLLLVLTEAGEVVLLNANSEKHEELAKFKAIEGKTWNHPTIAQGRLYVRNDLEIAAFDLPGASGPGGSQ